MNVLSLKRQKQTKAPALLYQQCGGFLHFGTVL